MIERLLKGMDVNNGNASKGRFLAVVGPSGSGKSSLVRAGLVPALRVAAVPGSDCWFLLDMIPGAHPYEELEAALLRVAVNPPASLLEQLQADERGFVRTVKRCLPPDEAVELLLLVDQFEELFTLVQDPDESRRFLDSLHAAVMDPASRVRLVITLSADFYDRPLMHPLFSELVQEHTEVVVPLTADELTEAVEQPARDVGASMEPGLTARIVTDVHGEPGALPLLQYAMTELFEKRLNGTLTQEAYKGIGGVLGALGIRAEGLYQELDGTTQAVARQIFLRLVTLGEGVEDTRRRVLRSEIVGLNVDLSTVQTFNTVLDTFGRHRFFTFDLDPVTREPTVEVAHEALLREWPRLRGWLDESREDIYLQRQVARAAGEWKKSGRDSSFLIPGGAKLEQFTTWHEATGLALTQVEADFLQASIIADSEKKERQARQERTQRSLQRGIIGALIVGLIVAIGLSIFAFSQRQEARRQASIGLAALAESELGAADRERGVLLALEAVEHYPYTPHAVGALALAVEEFREFRVLDASESVANLKNVATWSPDGGRVAAGSSPSPNSVVIWDAATGSELLSVNTHGDLCKEDHYLLRDLTWSPNGDRLAVIAQDTNSGEACGTVVLNTTSGETLLTLTGYDSASRSLDWSPDGASILTAHEDGTARLWDANTGIERLTLTGHTAVVRDAVFSPDGDRIASASEDGTVRLWEAETGTERMVLSGHAGPVQSVYWSPDGTQLVTGGNDGLPRVWDSASGETLLVLPGHTEDVVIVTWSPDGRRIASQSFDATVKVWDAATGGLIFQITNAAPEAGTKRGFVEFSPDGNWILAGGTRVLGTRLWDASISVPILFGHTFGQEWGDWSPDGTLIATSGTDGSARLWDAITGQQLKEFDQGSNWGDWSPDGTRLVFSDGIGALTLTVWDVATGEMLSRLSAPDDEYGTHAFLTMAWSPDGSFIAAADFRPLTPQAVYIWDAETTELVKTIRTDDVCMLGWPRWSPDGTRIAGGCIFVESGINTPARIWDSATGEELMKLESEYGWTFQTKWSPDGTQILTAHENSAAIIWDAETGESIITLTGHHGPVDGEWSPDGTLIASTDVANQLVKVWDSKTSEELMSFSVPGAPMTINWSPEGTHVIVTGDGLNEPIIKRVWTSTDELVEHAYECCVFRKLTPEERVQFGLPPQP
jgi:WD40 repeat protein